MKTDLSKTCRWCLHAGSYKGLTLTLVLILLGGCKKSTSSGGSSADNAANARFPKPVLDVLAGAPEVMQNWTEVKASPAPDAAVQALRQSSDPAVKQLGDLEAALAAEQKDFTEKEAAIEQSRRGSGNTGFLLHEEDVDTGHHDLYGREITERRTVDDTTPGQRSSAHRLVDLLDAEYPKRFEFVQHIQQLPAVLRQLAAERGARPDGSKLLNIRLNENSYGTVIVQNTSTQPLHHCLVMVIGEEIREDPLPGGITSGFSPWAAGAFFHHADEVAQMPSVAIVYRDQLSPGENIVAPASKSQNLERLTKSTVTVWSDEVDCPDVVLNDVKGTYQRSQAAADQCRLDQIKSVHVTEENGFLTYRFLVFSQAASQAIVVPENAKAVIFAKNVPDAAMYSELQTGYTVFPGRRYSWQLVPGPTPSPPSPVAVRFALRNPTEAEAATPLVADWPPPVITLPADEQAQHDLLVSWLKRGATVSGTIRPDGATTDMPFNLQLTWNDKTGAAAGWIRQPKQRRGESIYGRIIDRPNGQSSILIVEENSEGNYGLGGGANSLWCSYDMHVQQTAKPSELVVRSAIFGNFQSKKTADVTQQLQKLVKDGVLTADISWHSLPDPAPRMAKTLQLEYSINGVVNNMTMNEGNTLVLGTPSVAAGSLTGRVWADRNAGYPLPPFTGTASLSTNVFQDK